MRALVTGGGGFVGTRIAQMLAERGDDVLVLGRNRYAHHDAAGIATVRADLRDAGAVARACTGVDVVFQGHQHMYARVRPQAGIRYFVTGGGGKKPYSFKNNDNSYPREDNGKFNHFVYSRVSEERFEYCVIDEEEAVRDGGWFAKGDATDTEFPAAGCPIIHSSAGVGAEVAR